MRQSLDCIGNWLRGPEGHCRYVVTPNLDHIVRLQIDQEMRRAYAGASLVLADGWPVVTSSRWLRRALPERVPGSDLVPGLLAEASEKGPITYFLLGAMPGVAERAVRCIQARWPAARAVGTYSPPLGFEGDPQENRDILARIDTARPDLLVVGLGAPKQEIWISRHADQLRCKVAIACGATIDFLAGQQRRAPCWLQALRLEWLHRLLSDPRRLAKRYWHDARAFPALLWQEWRSQQG